MTYLAYKKAGDLKNYTHGGNLAKVRSSLVRVFGEAHRNGAESMMLFGYPGAGKTSIVESALLDLMGMTPGSEMDLVEFNCTALIAQYPAASSTLKELNRTRTQYLRRLPDLRVFVFDEIDAISLARDRSGDSGKQALAHFCMDTLGLGVEHVVWLSITNFPSQVDDAVQSRIGKRICLPCPDKEAARVILEVWLDKSHAAEVLEELLRADIDCALTVRALAQGLNHLLKLGRIEARRLRGRTPSEAAYDILGGGSFPQNSEVENYYEQHRVYLMQSDLLLRSYGL